MRNFQLDQCSDHPSLATRCNDEGECKVRRLPVALRDVDDSVILEQLLPSDAPIVTLDFGIVYDNRQHIIFPNGGIIIVKARPNTAALMQKMIAKFKQAFPRWSVADWSGIYLEIEHQNVYLSSLKDGDITGGTTLSFDLPDFPDRLEALVSELTPP